MTDLATIVLPDRSWIAPAFITLAALAGAVIWSSRRNVAEPWVAIVCGALKIAGVAALALCLLEPRWVSQRARPGANVFALIADNSQSLQVKDAGQTGSRADLLREQLVADPQGWQTALEENFQLRRYTFDSRLQSVRDFGELNFDGRASALGGALRTAVDRWRGQPVAGVLLFTDGNATDLAGELPALEGCPPVFPVVMGTESGLRDISVDKVAVSQTAFEDAPVTVQATVAAHGFGGSDIRAQLTEIATGQMISESNDATRHLRRVFPQRQIPSLPSCSGPGPTRTNCIFDSRSSPTKPGNSIFISWMARASGELKNPGGSTSEATLVNNRRYCSWWIVGRRNSGFCASPDGPIGNTNS